MTKVIAQNNDLWTLRKIQALVGMEADLLTRQIVNVQKKIAGFEERYGKVNREIKSDRVDDMELIAWEGAIETLERLRCKLSQVERIGLECK